MKISKIGQSAGNSRQSIGVKLSVVVVKGCCGCNQSEQKGALGEIAVCKELLKLGIDVFVQFGGHSKVDLVILDNGYKPYKIQIKTVTSRDDIVEVHSVKRCLNPKYDSTYTIEQVDIFAVYVIDRDMVFT